MFAVAMGILQNWIVGYNLYILLYPQCNFNQEFIEKDTCKICMEEKIVLMRCMHLSTCKICASSVNA